MAHTLHKNDNISNTIIIINNYYLINIKLYFLFFLFYVIEYFNILYFMN